MEELVTLTTQKTGLDAVRAEKALGIMLSLVKNQGDKHKVEELFAKLPGAAELAAKHGGDGAAKGGLARHAGWRIDGRAIGGDRQIAGRWVEHGPDQDIGNDDARLCQAEGRRRPGAAGGGVYPGIGELRLISSFSPCGRRWRRANPEPDEGFPSPAPAGHPLPQGERGKARPASRDKILRHGRRRRDRVRSRVPAHRRSAVRHPSAPDSGS